MSAASIAADKSVLEQPVPASLSELARTLEAKPWAIAAPTKDGDGLADKALQVTKDIFDLGISLEAISHPHLHPFLLSILEPPSVNLRSSTKAKTQKNKEPTPEVEKPESFLPYTPLSVLTTEGLDPEQVWAQLELRAEGISKTVKEVGAGEGNNEDDEDAEAREEDEDEEDSEEEMSVEEFRQMLIESGEEGVEDLDDDDIRALMEDTDSDEDGESGDEEDVQFNSDSDEDALDVGSDEEDEDENEEESGSGDDEVEGEIGSDDELSLGEEEDDEEGVGEEEDDEGDEGPSDEEEDDASDLFAGAGPSKPQSKSKRKAHPTLDDQFFSIDEFNRQTEEAEAGRLTSGRLGGDEDDDEDMEDVGAMMLNGAGDDDEITYADFFEPPRGVSKPKGGATKEKGKSKSKDVKGKGKGKGVSFDADELMEDDEEEADFDEEDQPRGVFGRVKGDLFESDDEEEQAEKNLSNHEKRQLALAKEIAELENEAIGPKDWTLLGEATSRARPENSLLEENLDFEQVAKVVPVITEESVKSLEDIIKARILDNNFDSPARVRAYEPTPFLPSRYFELQDTQSTKSLAQIYEEEYQAAATGGKAKDPRDEKLRKEHEEIDKLWGDICYKLDALSSLNFVPKAPKAQITTISDLPTTTMESALPPTAAASTMLAPEELFAPPTASSLVARSELTPEEAQKARQKARKTKQAEQKRLGDMADLYGKNKNGKKRMSVREEKEAALKGLVKSGKGVTVVGKGSKEFGKAKKRGAPDDNASREDGKRLKF
ncbi:hypothetical protein IAU59_006166 [Kwoniella sp. CBS 9459]